MVDEALVKEVLTREMINAGRKLTHQLIQTTFPVTAALWIYLADLNVWRLHIASKLVESKGPRHAYRKIHSLINKQGPTMDGLTLNDVTVIEASAPGIAALQQGFKGDALTEKRLKGVSIGGHYFSDAYIYKLL